MDNPKAVPAEPVETHQVWVVKLGGSLASDPVQLQRWLEILATDGPGRVVIAPGGGPYADLVRESQARLGLPDATAHRMAILAMEQFALTLTALVPGLTPAESMDMIGHILRRGGVAVWLPAAMTIGNPEIPESWDVTSDSLAAWLARRLQAGRLVLVKSCAVPAGDIAPEELRRLEIVDAAFPAFVEGAGFPVLALRKDRHVALRTLLQAASARR